MFESQPAGDSAVLVQLDFGDAGFAERLEELVSSLRARESAPQR